MTGHMTCTSVILLDFMVMVMFLYTSGQFIHVLLPIFLSLIKFHLYVQEYNKKLYYLRTLLEYNKNNG